MEFRAAMVDWMDRVSIIVAEIDHSTGRIGNIAKPILFELEPYAPGSFVQAPTFDLDTPAARSLMNALWNAGLRPTDYKSADAEVRRLENHLADMRKLVFKK